MPRCLLCSTNEEVRLNKWENNYVCLKLHLLWMPESWHVFQLPATGRQMDKSTKLHYGAIAPKNIPPDWSESSGDLSEWIWVTRFHFLLSPGWLWDPWLPETSRCWKTLYWWMILLVVLANNLANDHIELDWGVCLEECPTLLLTDVLWALTSPRPSLGLCFLLITWETWSGWVWRPFQLSQQKSLTNDLVSLKKKACK